MQFDTSIADVIPVYLNQLNQSKHFYSNTSVITLGKAGGVLILPANCKDSTISLIRMQQTADVLCHKVQILLWKLFKDGKKIKKDNNMVL